MIDVDASTMRIKASVPAVLGRSVHRLGLACVPYAGPQVGFVMLPEVGSGVWIEFEGGDVSFPIWTGCYWSSWRHSRPPPRPHVKDIITTAGSLAFDNDASSVTLAGRRPAQPGDR